jgi:hypothetical protein
MSQSKSHASAARGAVAGGRDKHQTEAEASAVPLGRPRSSAILAADVAGARAAQRSSGERVTAAWLGASAKGVGSGPRVDAVGSAPTAAAAALALGDRNVTPVSDAGGMMCECAAIQPLCVPCFP